MDNHSTDIESLDSDSEVRRIRKAMSVAAGHDVRQLAALYNARRAEVVDRIIDPGTKAEQCDPPGIAAIGAANKQPFSATL